MYIKKISKNIKILLFLIRAGTPLSVWVGLLKGLLSKNKKKLVNFYNSQLQEYQQLTAPFRFTSDWFSGNIPFWLGTFDEVNFQNQNTIRGLEIGCWEGRSSLFMLQTLPNLQLDCVDLWGGSQELRTAETTSTGEKNFDFNIRDFENRVTKYKEPSSSFLGRCSNSEVYDLIYIDGSHYFDDVLIDAIRSFELLKTGGVMIFDDYIWPYYPRPIDNVAGAVNIFLNIKKGSYRLIFAYRQIIIQKTKPSINRS